MGRTSSPTNPLNNRLGPFFIAHLKLRRIFAVQTPRPHPLDSISAAVVIPQKQHEAEHELVGCPAGT